MNNSVFNKLTENFKQQLVDLRAAKETIAMTRDERINEIDAEIDRLRKEKIELNNETERQLKQVNEMLAVIELMFDNAGIDNKTEEPPQDLYIDFIVGVDPKRYRAGKSCIWDTAKNAAVPKETTLFNSAVAPFYELEQIEGGHHVLSDDLYQRWLNNPAAFEEERANAKSFAMEHVKTETPQPDPKQVKMHVADLKTDTGMKINFIPNIDPDRYIKHGTDIWDRIQGTRVPCVFRPEYGLEYCFTALEGGKLYAHKNIIENAFASPKLQERINDASKTFTQFKNAHPDYNPTFMNCVIAETVWEKKTPVKAPSLTEPVCEKEPEKTPVNVPSLTESVSMTGASTYRVDPDGRIFNTFTGRFQTFTKSGKYMYVSIVDDNHLRKTYNVALLVWNTYHPDQPISRINQIKFIDGDTANCAIGNLCKVDDKLSTPDVVLPQPPKKRLITDAPVTKAKANDAICIDWLEGVDPARYYFKDSRVWDGKRVAGGKISNGVYRVQFIKLNGTYMYVPFQEISAKCKEKNTTAEIQK